MFGAVIRIGGKESTFAGKTDWPSPFFVDPLFVDPFFLFLVGLLLRSTALLH